MVVGACLILWLLLFIINWSAPLCRCINVLLTNPIWVVVTRMQVSGLSRLAQGSFVLKSSMFGSSFRNIMPIMLKHKMFGSSYQFS